MTHRRWFVLLIAILAVGPMRFLPEASAGAVKTRAPATEDRFTQGEAAFRAGNLPVAQQGFAEVVARQPSHLKARFRLGQVLLLLGKAAEALPHFQELLQQNPGHVTGRCFLARALAELGQSAEAKTHLNWILRVQPEHEEARKILGTLESGVQNVSRGTSQNGATAKAGVPPAGFEPMPMGAGSENGNGESSQKVPPTGPGPVLIGQGTVPPPAEAGIEGWRVSDFIGVSSASGFVALEYAKYCLEKDDLEKAVLHFDRAETMALEKQETRRFLEIQIYKGMLALYREDVRGFGQLLFKIKPMLTKETYQSFLDIYQKAQQASSPVDISRLVGGVAMGAEHFASARRLLGQAVAQRPGDVLSLRMKAQCELEMRDYAGAERSFLLLSQKQPNEPEVYLNLSRFYLTARFDPALARQHAQMAANLNPEDGRLLVLFSLIDLFDGRTKEAEARLKKAAKMTDDASLANMARKILEDPSLARGPEARANLASFLLLPGAPGAASDSLQALGESLLQRGSTFAALKVFIELKDLAEIGRTYLSMASSQFAGGEEKAAAVTAGFGMNALQEELRLNPTSAKSHLYLALYYSQRRDKEACLRHVQAGLKCPAQPQTRRQLIALRGAFT